LGYNVKNTHFRDIHGAFLFSDPISEEYRLYNIGETFLSGGIQFKVERVALVDNTQHINLSVVEEDVKITEPHF
jgi:hypothetical protein